MNDEIVIKADGVYKDFVLPHQRANSIKGLFMGMAKKPGQKTTETQHALKNISFEVKKGEFFGIVGRNGSGKSTMLKILANIYQPSQGTISTKGKLVPFIELGVGFNPELTGRENVFLNGAMLGFSRKEVENMYDDIVSFAEIENFMDQKLKNYSSGMQVRLAFSMATRSEADILLIDEVLAVGDADFQRKCFDYFRQLKRNKKTVIFVSHDMSAIREYCDRAVMIEKSEVIASGTSEKIATKYTKMFIEEAKDDETDNSNSEKRWGSGEITYQKVKTIVTEQNINIRLAAIAHKTVENLNFGFAISDATGHKLLGTNTQIKKIKIDKIPAGNSVSLEWQFPNILKDGRHYVDIALVGIGGEVWDWWDEATSFTIVKEETSIYIINPSIDVELQL